MKNLFWWTKLIEEFVRMGNRLRRIEEQIVSFGPNLVQNLCAELNLVYFWDAPNKLGGVEKIK